VARFYVRTLYSPACLPCAAVSAWNALFVSGQTKPGDCVLIQGTGGVSLFALMFAKAVGAEVILTSSSNEKLDRGAAMGADHLINYRTTPEWGSEARRIAGRGIDLVIEVGDAGTLEQSFIAVRNGGQISFIGVVSGVRKDLYIEPVGYKSIRLQGIRVGSRRSFEDMVRGMTLNKLRPCIDKVFAFEEARSALTHLKEGGHFGKICVDFSS
jgi:NADPH:quinone reductase-like Zn-dependent oxidoreductase